MAKQTPHAKRTCGPRPPVSIMSRMRRPRLVLPALTAGVAALAGCTSDRFRVIEKSMEPTIPSGTVLTLDEEAYTASPPRRGAIVVAAAPRGYSARGCEAPRRSGQACPRPTAELDRGAGLVKRVAAVGGDTVAIAPDGGLVLNGRRRPEVSVRLCPPSEGCGLPVPVRVPAGHFFLLGDNRPYSSDSRYWGPVPRRAIQGAVERRDRP